MASHYNILGIESSSSEKKIVKAFETKLSNEKDEIKSKEIIHAYLILGNEKRRKFYDLILKLQKGKNSRSEKTIKKYESFLIKYEQDAKNIVSRIDLIWLLDIKVFWKVQRWYFFYEIFGLNILNETIDDDDDAWVVFSDNDLDANNDVVYFIFVLYIVFNFGIVLCLGLYNSYFYLLYIPVFIRLYFRHYSRIKMKHYKEIFEKALAE